MAAHFADILRQNLIMPLNPFVIIDILPFTHPKIATMHNAASILHFYRNGNMQAFVVNDTRHGIFGAIRGVIPPANAYQMKFLTRNRIITHRMKAKATNAITPGNPAR